MNPKLQLTKLIRDGKVAVLVSPGFGSGWSNGDSFLAMHNELVWLAERHAGEEEVEKFLKEKGYEGYYMGGWHEIEVEWVLQGELFYIHEYDGSEHIVTQNEFMLA